MVVQTRHSGWQEIGDELREEERRLLGPVIQMKLGITDTLCQAASAGQRVRVRVIFAFAVGY